MKFKVEVRENGFVQNKISDALEALNGELEEIKKGITVTEFLRTADFAVKTFDKTAPYALLDLAEHELEFCCGAQSHKDRSMRYLAMAEMAHDHEGIWRDIPKPETGPRLTLSTNGIGDLVKRIAEVFSGDLHSALVRACVSYFTLTGKENAKARADAYREISVHMGLDPERMTEIAWSDLYAEETTPKITVTVKGRPLASLNFVAPGRVNGKDIRLYTNSGNGSPIVQIIEYFKDEDGIFYSVDVNEIVEAIVAYHVAKTKS